VGLGCRAGEVRDDDGAVRRGAGAGDANHGGERPAGRGRPLGGDRRCRRAASCRFAEESLWVRRESAGSFRCRGPNRALPGNLRVEVNVRLISPGSCAALWLRFRPYRGYQVRVCESVVLAGTHKDATARALRTFPLDTPVVANGPAARITVSTRDDVLEVTRDGRPVGTLPLTDPEITDGYLVLGIFTEPRAEGHTPPYAVAFDHVDVYGLS